MGGFYVRPIIVYYKSVVQNEIVVYLHLDRLIINIKYSSPHFLFIIYCLYRIATDIEIYEKIFFFLGFILSVFMLSSCDKDDDNKDKNTPVFNNKKLLVYCSNNESGLYGRKYEYDSYGRPTQMYNSEGQSEKFSYNYNDLKFSVDLNNTLYDGRLTTKGYFETRLSSWSDISYFYDENDHLVSELLKNEREQVEYTWIWVNDNIVTITEKHKYSNNRNSNYEISFAFKYTNDLVQNPIENKAGIPFIFFSRDNIEPTIALKNLLGEATKHLPVSLISETGEYRINWTLDSEGYPIKVDFDKKSLYFTWN